MLRTLARGWLLAATIAWIVFARGNSAPPDKPVLVLQGGSATGYLRVAFSSDGRWLASAPPGGPAILWEAATGRKVREFPPVNASVSERLPTGGIRSGAVSVGRGGLSFSPDGKFLASTGRSIRDLFNGGTWQRPPVIWEVTTGNPVAEGAWTVGGDHIAQNPNSPWTPGEVSAWQFAKDEQTARQFSAYLGPAQTISADGHRGARITEPRDKAAIEILDVPSNRTVVTLPGPFLNAYGLAIAPDGNMLALKYQGYGFEVWDLSVPKKLATLDSKSWFVDAMAFSPDGKFLATAGDGDSLHVFDCSTWKEIFSAAYGEPYSIHELVFSADGRRLAGTDVKLRVWDMRTLREIYELGGPELDPVTALAASPDGRRLAVARRPFLQAAFGTEPAASLDLWPLDGGAPATLPRKTYDLENLAFSPDSSMLAATGQQETTVSRYTNIIEGDLLLWDLAHNREIQVDASKLGVDSFGPAVFFFADGKRILTGALRNVTPPRNCSYVECGENESLAYARLLLIMDASTGAITQTLLAGKGNANLPALSPDGQFAVTANEKTLRRWDLSAPALDTRFEPQLSDPSQSAAYPSDSCAAGFSGDYANPVVDALAYFPDGRSLIVAQPNGVISVLDAVTGAKLRSADADHRVRALVFRRDGTLLASAHCGAGPRLWDPRSLVSRELEAPREDCAALAFSADAATLACGGATGVIFLWDVPSGSLVARVLRAPDGAWLVVTPDGLFDASPEGVHLAAWRVGNQLVALPDVPRSFQSPGLLQALFAGQRPKAVESLESALRRISQP